MPIRWGLIFSIFQTGSPDPTQRMLITKGSTFFVVCFVISNNQIYCIMTEKDRQREQELVKKYEDAIAKSEFAKSEMEGARNRLQFEENEAKGMWGTRVAPFNTDESRNKLYEEWQDKEAEYRNAKWEEENAKSDLETFRSFGYQIDEDKELEEEDIEI